MLNIVKFEPDPYPENWQPALSICAFSDEQETFCHTALPSEEFCLSAIAAGVVIFLPVAGTDGGVPLVPIRWALKHSRVHRTTLRRINKLLRGVASAPHSENQNLGWSGSIRVRYWKN